MADCMRVLRKKTSRAKENILAGLGKADRTVDHDFVDLKDLYLLQKKNGYQLRKALRDHLISMKVSNQTLRSLFDSINIMYEPELRSPERLKHLMQDCEASWDQYLNRSEKVFQDVVLYSATFTPIGEKIEKRNRKLVDYDRARHAYETVITSARKTPESVKKVTVDLHATKRVYEELNNDLLNSLPALFDSRLPFILKTSRNFFYESSKFHEQTHKVTAEITDLLEASQSSFEANPPKPRIFVRKHLPDIDGVDYERYQIDAQTLPIISHELGKYETGLHEESNINSSAPSLQHVPNEPSYCTAFVQHRFIAAEPGELSLEIGQAVEVLPSDVPLDVGWMFGRIESTGDKGIFPAIFVRKSN